VEVRITGRHAHIEEDVKTYVHEKLLPLSRYYDRTRQLEVVFEEAPLGWRVEVIAHIARSKPLVAKVQQRDAMAAVDLAHDKLERLLTREKEKRRQRRHRDGHAAAPASGESPGAREEE
jgi:ribosomal subunit interface protein